MASLAEVQDWPAHLRVMLGDLRGREAPQIEVVQKLYDLNPRYRITWQPPIPERRDTKSGRRYPGLPALWMLHEAREGNKHDELRKAAAKARLARYERWSVRRQQIHLGLPYQMQDWMAGYHTIGRWVEAEWATDWMFTELALGEKHYREALKKVNAEALLDDTADEMTLSELDENPAFRAQWVDGVRQQAKEDWRIVFRGKHSVDFVGVYERVTGGKPDAGTNGQLLAGPGQGVDHQRERGTGQATA